MKHLPVGRTGVNVTELGFGAAQIGNLSRAIDTKTALDAVDAAWDEGVRYFDTAPDYGLGLSELRLVSPWRLGRAISTPCRPKSPPANPKSVACGLGHGCRRV